MKFRHASAFRVLAMAVAAALVLLMAGCSGDTPAAGDSPATGDTRGAGDTRDAGDAGRVPETVEGFWFFTYSGQGDAPSGEAFAYVTENDSRLGGGIASEPLGGPLLGSLEGAEFTLGIEDVSGSVTVEAEGLLDGEQSRGRWTAGGDAVAESSGTFEANRFKEGDVPPQENPFVGEWNNFEDGGVTTLIFDENFRFTGSEADLDFTGRYAFDPSRGLVGVYEADGSSVHMEKLSYRFEGSDVVVLNGSVYRRQ